MFCEWSIAYASDGKLRLTCGKCGAVRVHDSANYFRECDSDPGRREAVDYARANVFELREIVLRELACSVLPLQDLVHRLGGCNRIGGVVSGLVSSGLVSMDSEKLTHNSVLSIAGRETESNSIDAVYPLGTGSRWQDNELRYSLRSLEKNFPEIGRVFIVGQKPAWLQNVTHIPLPDKYRQNKDANLIAKVLAACNAGVSVKFLRISDDEFFLRPIRYAEMAPLHHGDLNRHSDSWFAGKWKSHLRNTRDRLRAANCSAYHFDVHCPNAYRRETFQAVMAAHPWATVPMTINTLYYNAAGIAGKPAEREKATFERAVKNDSEILDRMRDAVYFNVNDRGLTDAMKNVLQKMYPEPSRFENDRCDPAGRVHASAAVPSRGIVMLAGGPIYATNAYINCRMLRHLGCDLPIEWFYLGAEMSPAWANLIERTVPNVRLVDLGGANRDNTKGKGGWQAKVEAVIESGFDEILFLDADSFPLRDPTDLFEHRLFREHDCILWPDVHLYDAAFQAVILKHYGVRVSGRQIESGQMLFRKSRCLPGLLKTREINRNSRAAYTHFFGDKDTFLVGAKQGGVDVIVNPHVVRRCSQRNLMQHDLDGKKTFVHLTYGKWRPDRKALISMRDYPHLEEAVKIFKELEQSNAAMTAARMEINMRVRDTFCAMEAARIVNDDPYKILPMIGHRVPVRYIVDIGANAGAFTYAASAAYPNAEILVIEPDPELMADIRYNTRNCTAKLQYVEAACVGRKIESAQFVRLACHRAGSYVRETPWGQSKSLDREDEEITVPVVLLSELLERFGFSTVDILKIDAEGVEGEVLLDLKKAGWMPRVHWIRGEWHGLADWPLIDEALRDTHEYRLQDSPDNGELIAHNRMDA